MIEKITRPQQFNKQEMQIPRNIQELMQRYDLDSNDIRDYLDYLITQIDGQDKALDKKFSTHIVTTKGTNLNDYTTEGRYYFSSSVTPINIPTGVNGLLEVFVGTDFIKQIWYRHGTINSNDFQTFVRTYTISGWSDWRRFVVDSDIYYRSGDTFTITAYVALAHITSSGTSLQFTMQLPKNMDNVTPNFTAGKISIRTSSGGYLVNGEAIVGFYDGITLYKSGNVLTVYLKKTDGYGAVNNAIYGVALSNFTISFN